MNEPKEHGVVERLTWADGTIMARWRPDGGEHETIASNKDPTVVNQTIYRWLDDMQRLGWRKAASTGAVTHLERRPPKRHAHA